MFCNGGQNGVEGHRCCFWMGVVLVGGRSSAVVVFAHDPGGGILLHAILHAVQVVGEPSVHKGHGRRAAVAALVVVYFGRQAHLLGTFEDSIAVLRHDVPVIEAVGHEQGGFHGVHLVEVVAARPKVVVIAGGTVHVYAHL